MKRPKNLMKLCKECFIIYLKLKFIILLSRIIYFIVEKNCYWSIGGKDSTVLASILKTLNERYDYGLNLVLSIDEGIKGYRDDSLATVKEIKTI